MRRKLWPILIAALILAFPIGFMWQGLELTDTGYALANMQQFLGSYPADLNDPGIGSCWLTYCIGGMWYKVLGGCGVIGFRVLYLLILFCTVGSVWALLRNAAGIKNVLLAILAGVCMVVGRSAYLPSYNEFTVLFFTLSALGLYYGLITGRRSLVFLSGGIGGAAVLLRLPNLAIAGIVIAILFFRANEAVARKCSWKSAARLAFRECAVFAFGYLTGFGLLLLLMAAMRQVPAYFQALHRMSAMLGDPTQHHGGGRLLRGLLHDYFYSGLAGVAFLAIGGLVAWVAGRTRNRIARFALILVCTVVLTWTSIISEELALYLWPGVIYSVLFLGAAGLLRPERQYRLVCVLAGAVLFLTPLGSNNGIYNAVYAMSLAVPVAIIALFPCQKSVALFPHREEEQANGGFGRASVVEPIGAAQGASPGVCKTRWWSGILAIRALDASVVGYAMLCSMIISSSVHRWSFTYRDSAQRLTLFATVNHPKLRGVFTTRSRARCVEGLLGALQPLIRKDDYLLDYMQVPMLYFLTDTRPYLYSTWANLYEPPVFEQMLRKAESAHRALPVCVRTKVDTCHPEWPDKTFPLVQSYRFAGNRRLFEAFLETHNYYKYWDNNAFEIWLPRTFQIHG